MRSSPEIQAVTGTLDGDGASDCDQPYMYGRRPSANATGPFTTREYVRLLVLRSRIQAGDCSANDLHSA